MEDCINNVKPLRDSVLKIEELFLSQKDNIKNIVDIIETDPFLSTKILILINSSLYSFKNEIIDITQAVTLLGLNETRSICLKIAMDEVLPSTLSPYNINTNDLQKISHYRSTFMFYWCMLENIDAARYLVPTSMLSVVGKTIVAEKVIKTHQDKMFSNEIKEDFDNWYVENFFTGYSSEEISALLFKHWNLSSSFYTLLIQTRKNNIDDEDVLRLKICFNLINEKYIFNEKDIEKSIELIDKSNLLLNSKKLLRAIDITKKKLNI